MSENMFEDDEEVLQRDVIWVKLSPELEAALNDLRIERMDGQDVMYIMRWQGSTKRRRKSRSHIFWHPEWHSDAFKMVFVYLLHHQLADIDQITPLDKYSISLYN